jgi:hypothetical protein
MYPPVIQFEWREQQLAMKLALVETTPREPRRRRPRRRLLRLKPARA